MTQLTSDAKDVLCLIDFTPEKGFGPYGYSGLPPTSEVPVLIVIVSNIPSVSQAARHHLKFKKNKSYQNFVKCVNNKQFLVTM